MGAGATLSSVLREENGHRGRSIYHNQGVQPGDLGGHQRLSECERRAHPVHQKRTEGDLPLQRRLLQLCSFNQDVVLDASIPCIILDPLLRTIIKMYYHKGSLKLFCSH